MHTRRSALCGSPLATEIPLAPAFQIVSAPGLAEKINTVFDPLTRVSTDEEATPTARNLGLGLYITKEVVEARGETIEVTSTDIDGTVFTARFQGPCLIRPDRTSGSKLESAPGLGQPGRPVRTQVR